MYTLTPESLQNISVKVVSRFMKKEASLSQAVADEASHLELNPEQVKRVIEASNSVAYLRQLQDASDRTFEFPVADYNQVLGHLALPEAQSSTPSSSNFLQEKQATGKDSPSAYTTDFSEHERLVVLARELTKSASVLQNMEIEARLLQEQLTKQAFCFGSKEKFGLEKLAEVCDESNFEQLKKLTGFEKSAAQTGKLFTEKDLVQARNLVGLLKEAQDFSENRKSLLGQVSRAKSVLEKSAGFIESALGGVGQAIGTTIRAPLSYVAGKVDNALHNPSIKKTSKTVGKFGLAVSMSEPLRSETPDVWESLHGN